MDKMKSIKSAAYGFAADVACGANEVIDKVTKPVNKAMIYGMTAVMTSVPFLMEAHADSNTLFSNAENALKDVFKGITGIVNIASAVCAIIALMFLIFSKNQRSVESAKEWLKRIAIGFVCINCLGWIIDGLKGFTNGGEYNA